METLISVRVQAFLNYVRQHDMQILAHRRAARHLAANCEDDGGDFEFPSDMWQKLTTYLALNDQQVHYSSAGDSVSTYSFVRICGQLKQQLKTMGYVMTRGSVSPAPAVGAAPAAPGGGGGGGPSSSAAAFPQLTGGRANPRGPGAYALAGDPAGEQDFQ